MTTCTDCQAQTENPFICNDCKIVRDALDAFWAVVAAAHPEIHSGDGDDSELRQCALEHVRQWVSDNTPCTDEAEASPLAA